MIYQTVNAHEFIRAFDEMGRSDNFSACARNALFDYYSELSESIGEDVELDVIAICCEWGEYTAEHLIQAFSHLVEREPGMEDNEYLEAVIQELQDDGYLIEVPQLVADDTYLYCQ